MPYRIITFVCFCVLISAGCTPPQPAMKPGGTENLAALQRLSFATQRPVHGKKTSEMRFDALRDTAMSVGARSGLAYRARQLDKRIEKRAKQLDQVFNFNALILDHNVLPPVLVEGRETLNLTDNKTIHLADRNYRIVNQARFTTTPPTWRTYLEMKQYQPPEPPDRTLLPRDRHEAQIWKKYVKMGWENGLKQADRIYVANLAKLKRDYKGMVLYRELLQQNIVSAPFVAKVDLGVTGNNHELNVHDQILRISALPAMNKDSSTWKSIVAHDTAVKSILKHSLKEAHHG